MQAANTKKKSKKKSEKCAATQKTETKAVHREPLTFVFEVCTNCQLHRWHSRHNEAQYRAAFDAIANAILEQAPDSICLFNMVPKAWHEKDLYQQLIPNSDQKNPYYDFQPRLGAFEVSTVINGTVDILFFSKTKRKSWPNVKEVIKGISNFIDLAQTWCPAAFHEVAFRKMMAQQGSQR